MTSDALEYLGHALSHIAQENFGRRAAPMVTLSSDTHQEIDGSVTGALEIHIQMRSGEARLIQRAPFTALNSKTEIDDLLAQTLSVLLMNHASWPR
jgi:hypothetical protein